MAAWKGSIRFGLVNIPVLLHPAFKSKALEFHLIHKLDQGRVGYQKVCKLCGQTLKEDDIVKAFEHEKDSYVPLEKEELQAARAPDSRSLEISLFAKEQEIDSKLYDRVYYVTPAKNAENLYVLLREALRSSGRAGIGKIQFGGKEHLAALKVEGPVLLLNLMHFIDELEDPKLLPFPAQDAGVGKKELDLARQLVATMEGPFDAAEFQDSHRARLQERIEDKVAREATGDRGAPEKQRKVVDLMERLRQSLQEKEKAAPHTRAHHTRAERPRRRKVG